MQYAHMFVFFWRKIRSEYFGDSPTMAGEPSPGDYDAKRDLWMIRPCEAYLDEFKECKSFRARFHQKYTSGEAADCSKWKENFDNCMAFRKTRDIFYAEKIVENELVRREERLKMARGNDVWNYRTSPPDDWNKPLPEEQARMKLPTVNSTESSCVIS